MTHDNILAGPVLLLRGSLGERRRLSALFLLEGEQEPEDLDVDGVSLKVPPRHVAGWRDMHVWRFDFAVAPLEEETFFAYGFVDRGKPWRFAMPGRGQAPRIAFASGVGVNDDAEQAAMWRSVAEENARRPLHALLHGGGQIDGSAVWRDCPTLAGWFREHGLGVAAPEADRLTEDMAEEAMDFFLTRYVRLWREPSFALLSSSVPALAMWDDHETYTGFSRMNAEQRKTRPIRGAHLVARRWFCLFQLGATDDALPDSVWRSEGANLTQGARIGDLGVLALDLVSERRRDRMMSDASWSQLPDWLARFAGCENLLVISARPPLLPAPMLPQWLPDPLHQVNGAASDHWRASVHATEWNRLLRMLLGLSEHTGCRVTLLSGVEGSEAPLSPPPAHPSGFQGRLQAPGGEIRQLTSSAMRLRRPSPLAAKLAEHRALREEHPRADWRLTFSPVTANGGRYIRQANWLLLEPSDGDELSAAWMTPSKARTDRDEEDY
jgi:hypothetical protein